MDMFRNLQMAGAAAVMDVVTIAEFAAINYVRQAVVGPIANIAPPGIGRTLLAQGVEAAGDIAKLIIFSSNQVGSKS